MGILIKHYKDPKKPTSNRLRIFFDGSCVLHLIPCYPIDAGMELLAVRPQDLHRLRRDNGCVFPGEVAKKVVK